MPPALSSVRYSCPKPKLEKKTFAPALCFPAEGPPFKKHTWPLYTDLLLLKAEKHLLRWGEAVCGSALYLTPLISGSTCLQKHKSLLHAIKLLFYWSTVDLHCGVSVHTSVTEAEGGYLTTDLYQVAQPGFY